MLGADKLHCNIRGLSGLVWCHIHLVYLTARQLQLYSLQQIGMSGPFLRYSKCWISASWCASFPEGLLYVDKTKKTNNEISLHILFYSRPSCRCSCWCACLCCQGSAELLTYQQLPVLFNYPFSFKHWSVWMSVLMHTIWTLCTDFFFFVCFIRFLIFE